MSAVTIAAIRQLRELTDAGLLDCRAALDEADGDTQRAVQLLLAQGRRAAPAREQRAADNGALAARVNEQQTHAVLVELRSETDFVAKSDRFVRTLDGIADLAAARRPADRDALLTAAVSGSTVRESIDALGAAVGENVVLGRYTQLDGEFVAPYLHRTSPDLPPQIGVLVALDRPDETLAADVAQHIAAMAPVHVSREDVSPAEKAQQRREFEQDARSAGKPDHVVERIVEGRLRAGFAATVLREQPYVKDDSGTVGELLDRRGATVNSFVRFHVTEPPASSPSGM